MSEKSKTPKTGILSAMPIEERLADRNAPPVTPSVIATVLHTALPKQMDKFRIECPLCSKKETPVYTVAGSTGPLKTYYYCANKEKGCRFSHQVTRPGVNDRLLRRARGEQVRTPVKDGGSLGGLPPV